MSGAKQIQRRPLVNLLALRPSAVVAAGFAVVLALMLVLIALTYSRVHLLHGALEEVVEEHNEHSAQTFRMQEAARRRSQILHRIVFDDDPFVREEQTVLFYSLATEFGEARKRFMLLRLTPDEKDAVNVLSVAVADTLQAQQQVIELSQAGNVTEARRILFDRAIPTQLRVYEALGQLVRYQQVEVAEYGARATHYERQARWMLLVGGGVALLLSALLALFAVLRIRSLVATIRAHAVGLERIVAERTAEVREREEVLHRMASAANDAVVMIDHHDVVTFWNRAAEQIFGFPAEEAIGHCLHDLIMPERYREMMKPAFAVFSETGKGSFVGGMREVTALRRDGSEFAAELSLSAVQVQGNWHAIGLVRDITDRKRAENVLKQMATTDPLTGVSNRRKFDEVLDAELKRAIRYQMPLTLVLFDIDRFKSINDTHGHVVGDQVLVEMARLVAENVRANDHFARWGGEEFALLATHCDEALTEQFCEKLRALIETYVFPEAGQVTCSFGLSALRPDDSVRTLVERADEALYRAKSLGRNRVCRARGEGVA